ncbi:MAG TPA: GNAT family N-acetyltransferase [Rhizomicrobium sp.]|nr:GNAT family N-acetyltransferase [Rhizomicrobium sp.]
MSEASSNIRAYSGRADLVLLQDFASRALAARFPLEATWHPGDFSWQLMPDYDRSHRVRMWLNGDAVKAVAMFEAPGRLFLEILPQSAALLPQIVARAERSAQHAGQPALYVRVYDGDQDRVAALSRLGYAKSAPEGVVFRCDLSQPLPTRDLAPGFRIRDCTGIDPVGRAKAHRDARDDLSEIGLPEARSSFTTEVYDGLRRAPGYDPTLDILVEDEHGELVANCIAWLDDASGIGSFEPVGTHARFRRRGLARFAVQEGLRRLQERGMRWGRVSTAHFNAPAIAAYAASGFELHDRSSWWSKAIAT